MKLQSKIDIVEKLQDRLSKAEILISTDYKGLDAEAMNSLRRKLRESKVEYQVIKNTLLRRASEKAGFNVEPDVFKGSTAVALTDDDPALCAKVLSSFMNENKKLEIKFGVMRGELIDAASIKALSELPSKEVLLSQLLSALNGTAAGFARALNDLPCRLVNVLNAVKEQKEAA